LAIDHALVSFVTIATTGAIFSLQFTKKRLAAGLRLTRWGSLSAPPDSLAAKRGPTSKGRERAKRERDRMGGEGKGKEGTGKKGKGKEWERREGRGGVKRRGKGEGPLNANSWIRPWGGVEVEVDGLLEYRYSSIISNSRLHVNVKR